MSRSPTTTTVDVDPPPSDRSLPAYRCVYIGLGGLLIVAALLKTHQLVTVPLPPSAWLSPAATALVVQAELLLAMLLVLGVSPRWLWWIALFAFSSFGIVTLQQALQGHESCGCFGRVEVSPWWTFVMDVTAVALLLCWPPSARESWCARRGAWAVLVYGAVGAPVALAIARFEPQSLGPGLQALDGGKFVLLEPQTWSTRAFPLTPYLPGGEQLGSGRWIVVLFHHDCSKCQEVLPAYERSAAAGTAQRTALIELPPYGPAPSGRWTSCVWLRLSPDYEWFVTTPVEIHLEEGIVTKVVPNPKGVSGGISRDTAGDRAAPIKLSS